jgi:hypothetical protein
MKITREEAFQVLEIEVCALVLPGLLVVAAQHSS